MESVSRIREEERRAQRVRINLTAEEYELLRSAAEADGLAVGAWAREAVLERIRPATRKGR